MVGPVDGLHVEQEKGPGSISAKVYDYDAAGNTTLASALGFTYNQANRLAEVSTPGSTLTAYAYNAQGQRVKKTGPTGTTLYHYDQSGQLIAETDTAGNTLREYVYLDGERLALLLPGGDASLTFDGELLGTPVPQLMGIDTAIPQVTLQEPGRAPETLELSGQYWSDRDNPDGSRHIAFDWRQALAGGTAQRQADITLTATGGVSGHLYTYRPAARDVTYFGTAGPDGAITVTDAASGAPVTWRVDTLAHTVTLTDLDAQTETYAIAPADWVEEPWGAAIQYRFRHDTGAGLVISGALTRFDDGFAFGDLSIIEGQIESAYYILTHVQDIPAADTAAYYVHTDHLGTPQRITDASQATVWQADYEPFGKATVTTAVIDNPLRFPGQYFDVETGLHYNYFRNYDPSIGRYIESDPIGLDGGLNTYLYAEANPVRFVDLYGQEAVLPFPGASAAGAGATGTGVAGAVTAGAAVLGAGLAGYGIGSLIYPHIAEPLGDAIDAVCRESADPEDCRKEKEGCIELCAEIAETKDPNRQKVWGGSFTQCIQNCLPTRCGGEGIWKGYK